MHGSNVQGSAVRGRGGNRRGAAEPLLGSYDRRGDPRGVPPPRIPRGHIRPLMRKGHEPPPAEPAGYDLWGRGWGQGAASQARCLCLWGGRGVQGDAALRLEVLYFRRRCPLGVLLGPGGVPLGACPFGIAVARVAFALCTGDAYRKNQSGLGFKICHLGTFTSCLACCICPGTSPLFPKIQKQREVEGSRCTRPRISPPFPVGSGTKGG